MIKSVLPPEDYGDVTIYYLPIKLEQYHNDVLQGIVFVVSRFEDGDEWELYEVVPLSVSVFEFNDSCKETRTDVPYTSLIKAIWRRINANSMLWEAVEETLFYVDFHCNTNTNPQEFQEHRKRQFSLLIEKVQKQYHEQFKTANE